MIRVGEPGKYEVHLEAVGLNLRRLHMALHEYRFDAQVEHRLF